VIAILGAAGLVAFLVSSLTVGVRLLCLGRRTRGIPELSIGTGFVVGAVVGYVPETIVLSTDLLSPAREEIVLTVTQVAIRLAAFSILLFTWRVFRAKESWAAGVFGALSLALLVSYLAFPSTRSYATSSSELFWYDLFTVARTACLGWGAVESLSYYARARRRLRIRLLDPLVANRFLLWGIGLSSITLLMATTLFASAVGVDPAVPGWVLLESLAGLVGATTIWLTFFPSGAYRRLIEARAEAFVGGRV
jgi:hypothetical protein